MLRSILKRNTDKPNKSEKSAKSALRNFTHANHGFNLKASKLVAAWPRTLFNGDQLDNKIWLHPSWGHEEEVRVCLYRDQEGNPAVCAVPANMERMVLNHEVLFEHMSEAEEQKIAEIRQRRNKWKNFRRAEAERLRPLERTWEGYNLAKLTQRSSAELYRHGIRYRRTCDKLDAAEEKIADLKAESEEHLLQWFFEWKRHKQLQRSVNEALFR